MFWRILLFMLTTTLVMAETIVPEGNVSGTWNAAGSPYQIQGDISIVAGSSLAIEPGVLVNFNGAYALYVYGVLTAVGTETDSVRFTSPPGSYNWGLWHGIRISQAEDTIRMRYCMIDNARSEQMDFLYGGGMSCVQSAIVLEHCLFYRNLYFPEPDYYYARGTGLYADQAYVRMLQCAFVNNDALDGFGVGLFAGASQLDISNTDFFNNRGATVGGGMYLGSCTGSLSYCTLQGNQASFGGSGLEVNGSTVTVSHCTFLPDPDGWTEAVHLNCGTPILEDCEFTSQNLRVTRAHAMINRCRFDNGTIEFEEDTSSYIECIVENINAGPVDQFRLGGIHGEYGAPVFDRCIIRNNYFPASEEWWDPYGSGIKVLYSSARFTNCIFSNNTNAGGCGGAIYAYEGNPVFTFCTIDGNNAVSGGGVCLNLGTELNSCVISNSQGGALSTINGNPQIHHCAFYNNGDDYVTNPTMTNANSDPCDANFNFIADPLYVDRASGDFHLQDESHLIGAGLLGGAPATDFDGQPRPDPVGSNPDIGAFEHWEDRPLPVEMLTFEGASVSSGIRLYWRTASETDNDRFEVLRRDYPAANWNMVAAIDAAGNTPTGAEYSWTDVTVTPNRTYGFKLITVDVSGGRTEAGLIESVVFNSDAAQVTQFELLPNYPNPFNSSTTLAWLAPRAAKTQILLFDMLGQQVMVLSVTSQVGRNSAVLNANDLSTGIYIARLVADGVAINTTKLLLLR